MNDDVPLKFIGSYLATTDVLDPLGGDTKLLEHLTKHLREASIALAVNGKLNCWCHLQTGPYNGISRVAKEVSHACKDARLVHITKKTSFTPNSIIQS